MEQIRSLYRLLTTITCLVCVGFNVGICSESDASLIKSYVSSSLQSNDDLVYSSKLKVSNISGWEWDSLVMESKVPVMVMFTRFYCPLCETLSPIMDRLDSEYTGRFKFYTLDTEEETDIASRYNVRRYPTIVVFKDGDAVDVVQQYRTGDLRRLVEKYV